MPKIIPVPHPIFVLLYLLPLIVFGIVISIKLRGMPKEHRSSWLWLLSLTFSLGLITMSLMRIAR